MSRKPPPFPSVTEQMKAWSAALADEIATWPQATTKSFFGFTALYRDQIFGLLPRTRSLHSVNSIAFKIENPSSPVRRRSKSHPPLSTTEIQKARWNGWVLHMRRQGSNAGKGAPRRQLPEPNHPL